MKPVLSPEALNQALDMRDLTNPQEGPHAMQIILNGIIDALQKGWSCKTLIYRESPIVTIADNYDNLKYPIDGAAREARFTRAMLQKIPY